MIVILDTVELWTPLVLAGLAALGLATPSVPRPRARRS